MIPHMSAEGARLSGEYNAEIVICTDSERDEWQAYLENAQNSTVCHHFLWRSIIEQAYGHHPFYLMARVDSQTRGVLPLILVKSRLFGRTLSSMAFLDYGGVCAEDGATAEHLLDRAMQLLPTYGADYVELRQCQPVTHTEGVRLDKVGMRLDLASGIDKVWRSFPAKVRNQVRKAEKARLRVKIGGAELLNDFYSVFAVNMRDLGSPVHSPAFFAAMFAAFGERARIILVRDGHTPVGALICLLFKRTASVPWASSLRQWLPKCPNNLAYWEAIKYAANQGCTIFDFGRSSIGSGTYHFKQQWGAKPVQIYWQIMSANGKVRAPLSGANPKYQLAVELWKHLPLSLTTFVGPRLRKYITN